MKQAIAARADLGMGQGKLAAQVAHASLKAYENTPDSTAKEWKRGGQKKVVLKVQSEKDLYKLQEDAKMAGLPTGLVRDAGHTQLEPDTPTTVAIGPGSEDEIDRITGSLSLY